VHKEASASLCTLPGSRCSFKTLSDSLLRLGCSSENEEVIVGYRVTLGQRSGLSHVPKNCTLGERLLPVSTGDGSLRSDKETVHEYHT
jgi:hypothetical protein